jgi:hypothetical protein
MMRSLTQWLRSRPASPTPTGTSVSAGNSRSGGVRATEGHTGAGTAGHTDTPESHPDRHGQTSWPLVLVVLCLLLGTLLTIAYFSKDAAPQALLIATATLSTATASILVLIVRKLVNDPPPTQGGPRPQDGGERDPQPQSPDRASRHGSHGRQPSGSIARRRTD